MAYKTSRKKREATRERVRRYRARKAGIVIERVTHTVTQKDIDSLPLSLKSHLRAITRVRETLHLPDNLKERQEAVVRRFKGW